MAKTRSVLVSVAERSGDAHAARLVEEVRRSGRDIGFHGFGGELLKAAGCRIDHNSVGTASMGLGFLQNLGAFAGTLRTFDTLLRKERPDACLLVDAPGLHFIFARLARWRGVPVIYYICPQIWAWAPWRLGKVLRYTDLLLPILPFEEAIFRNDKVPVVPVGHPLADALQEIDQEAGQRLRKQLGIADATHVLALLPGSRHSEVEGLAPLFRDILDQLQLDPKAYTVLVSCFRDSFRPILEQAFDGCAVDCKILDVDARTITLASDSVVVASGTASLEVAYFQKPMVVLYTAAAWVHWARTRFLVPPFFTLPNLLGGAFTDGQPIVPEVLCRGDEAPELASLSRRLLEDADWRQTQLGHLRRIKEEVLVPGATARAAQALSDFVLENGESNGDTE